MYILVALVFSLPVALIYYYNTITKFNCFVANETTVYVLLKVYNE